MKADFDGVLRSVAPIMRYGNIYLPAYSLALVLEYLKINPATVIFSPAQGVSIGKSEIPLDGKSRMMITFNGPYRTFRYYSFRDVIDGRVDSGAFKDKIVIIGPTATGIATLDHTPLSSDLPPIEVIANITENILDSRFITRPPWVIRLDWSLIAIVSLFILFALPLLPAFLGLYSQPFDFYFSHRHRLLLLCFGAVGQGDLSCGAIGNGLSFRNYSALLCGGKRKRAH